MVILEKKVDGAAVAELDRFVRKAQSLTGFSGEVNVLITGNARVRELNRRFRRKNKPTDVLSFPRVEGGDIAISLDIARENAKQFGHSSTDELNVLITANARVRELNRRFRRKNKPTDVLSFPRVEG